MKKLIKGSRLDELPPDNPEGTWRLAKNMVNHKKSGSLSNENGADDITPIASPTTIYEDFPTKPVIGIIPINKSSVYFFSPSLAGNDSEIGIVDDEDRYHPIIRDIAGRIVLNFSLQSPIQGTFEFKFNNNLIIAWRDSINNPRILNTDCLPFQLDSNYNVVIGDLPKAQTLIKLFPDALAPEVEDLFLADNGGSLKTGTYFPIVSYELVDKSTTSWLKIYNPFPVVQDSSTIEFKDYDGDLSNITTSKRLHIKFNNVDTNYINLRFGVVILQAGQYDAYYISSFKINGTSLEFDYTGGEGTITPITLDDVLIPNAIYGRVKSITNLLGKLYLGGVEKREQINFQKYANLINIKWIRGDDITLTDTQSTSYKDEKIVFFNRSFRSNEVMAFYIACKYKDGTYSDAFHIPGRPALTGDTAVISGTGSADVDYLDSNVKNFQISETALNDGTMGYWENESEFYPNTDDFDSTTLGGLDLRGLPVRHHKFPEIDLFAENGIKYFNDKSNIPGTLVMNANGTVTSEFTDTFFPYLGLSNSTPNLTLQVVGDTTIITSNINNTVIRLEGTYNYYFNLEAPDPEGFVGVDFPILPNNNFNQTIAGTGSQSGSSPNTIRYIVLPSANVSELRIRLKGRVGTQNDLDPATLDSTLNITSYTTTTKSKPLGIRISNLIIPPEIAAEIDTWEIFYAERTNSNIRIIGQDIMVEERFHTFDLVYNQANLKGSYLKPQIKYLNVTNNFLQAGEETQGNPLAIQNGKGIKAIETFFYVGENTLSPVDNTGKSTSIYIKLRGETVPDSQINYKDIFWDICIYRKDVYKTFDSQSLVTTGRAFKVVGTGLQPVKDIYGGDTFISAFGFIEDITARREYLIPQESAANIGLRMDDEVSTPAKYYYPKHIKTDSTPPTISYYGYNNDYTKLNTLNKVFPRVISYDNCASDIYQFPYLISFSIDDGNESLKLNWRTFKINDYYDRLPKDKGIIWNILGANRTLYIQLEYALLIAEIKDTLPGTNEETATIGVSDIFDRPPIEVFPTTSGYVGSQSQFATLMTPMGYVTLDRQQGKIFVLPRGENLKEISDEGYYNFFKDNMQTDLEDIDNPYEGNGYTAAYDLDLRRLIIVKKSATKEFTISFSHDNNSWTSFHDYHPNYIFSTRSGLYAGMNTNFKLYKLNSKLLKGIFFDGIMYRSYVDVPFNQGQDVTKVFSNFNWITHVRSLSNVMIDEETITNLMVYNNNQCSGDILLQANPSLWFGTDARNTEETWNFNNFRDLIRDKGVPFLDDNGDLITSNIDNNKSWFDKNKFISKFVIVRFIYDNVNQRDLHIVSVDSNIKKSNR
jgi:hypothetical protein